MNNFLIHKRKPSSIFIASALILLLNRCISFNYGNIDSDSGKVNESTMPRKAIGLTVHYEYYLNGKKKEVVSNGRQAIRRELVSQAYQDSGLFDKIQEGSQGDLNISVLIIESAYVNQGLAMLTGITFGIFPSWGSSELFIKTSISDKKGNPIGKIEARSSSVTIMQIFLLAPMFLFYPPSAYDEYIIGTNRYSLNEALRKGLLVLE